MHHKFMKSWSIISLNEYCFSDRRVPTWVHTAWFY